MDAVKSWDILFKDLNNKKGKGKAGYQANEKIAVKVNSVLVTFLSFYIYRGSKM